MKKSKYILQIDRSIKEGQLSLVKGSYMEEFENEAAKMFGNKYGVSTCNGTSALYLSLFCLSLDSNKKEVIIPNYGFHVSVSVICSMGLKPVFCDVDVDTYTIDFDKCRKLINRNTLAVMVLQPWGNIANLDKIDEIRKKYNIFFISDSSHAHESTWNDQGIGKYFDINCASFGLGKLISGGELGVLTTDNPLFRDRALLFSHTNRVPWDFLTNEYKNIDNNVGIKFRPHLFSLLLALNDLTVNKKYRLKTRGNFLKFQEEMVRKTNKINFQKSYKKADRVFHMPVIEFQKEIDANGLIDALKEAGFHAQKHNYRTILSDNTITTEFYKIKVDNIFPAAQEIINKNIIQLYFSDFASPKKIVELQKIILGFLYAHN